MRYTFPNNLMSFICMQGLSLTKYTFLRILAYIFEHMSACLNWFATGGGVETKVD